MHRYIPVLVISLLMSLSTADAQLFKGRGGRQGGGGNSFNNGSMQTESRGGIFQRGRVRREQRQYDSNSQYSNNSIQQQPKTGLFGKEKDSWRGLFGNRDQPLASESKPGLFQKARERREADQNQSYNNSNNHAYRQYDFAAPSQSGSSFVRSTQKVTSGAQLFTAPNASTPSPASVTSSGSQATGNRNGQTQSISVSRVASQVESPALPAIVTANAKAEPSRPKTSISKSPKAVRRPEPQAGKIRIMGSSLKEAAPARPDAKPTGNLPNNDQPKVEIAAAVLA